MSGTGGRDLRHCLDEYGHIAVDVTIGHDQKQHGTGASADPFAVAHFLRDLADDIEWVAFMNREVDQ